MSEGTLYAVGGTYPRKVISPNLNVLTLPQLSIMLTSLYIYHTYVHTEWAKRS